MKKKINVFWFRRDLRLEDNTALYHALQSGLPVLPVFIFDTEILDQLTDKSDRRVDYIHQALSEIHNELNKYNSSLITFYGKPKEAFESFLNEYDVDTVFCNKDYEPKAIERDKSIAEFLKNKNIKFSNYKDQVIFEENEILKDDNSPYTVFTPYSKKWKKIFNETQIKNHEINFSNFISVNHPENIIELENMGFRKTDISFTKPVLDEKIINSYDKYRDYPSLEHTTQLGTALRFGTISVRKCVQFAVKHNEIWLNELIWREFFMQIMFHFPYVENHCFKKKYEAILWRNNEEEFRLWRSGNTGYPIVDAGMRQLNETGFMHNRVRMITASFLTKHLLIDWRWGESYFAEKLLDYDLSANNGNWQWAAGCGCDAAPYFRIFNPEEQTKKFDKDLKYIKKWLPANYSAKPVVDHKMARERALKTYKQALD